VRSFFVFSILLIATLAMVAGVSRLEFGAQEKTNLCSQPTESIILDHALLELHGNEFRYWHFSDVLGFSQYPISGTFTRDGEIIELVSDLLRTPQKRYVSTTIEGVTGTWAEKDLDDWRANKGTTAVPAPFKTVPAPF